MGLPVTFSFSKDIRRNSLLLDQPLVLLQVLLPVKVILAGNGLEFAGLPLAIDGVDLAPVRPARVVAVVRVGGAGGLGQVPHRRQFQTALLPAKKQASNINPLCLFTVAKM